MHVGYGIVIDQQVAHGSKSIAIASIWDNTMKTRFLTYLSLSESMTMTAGAIEMAIRAGPSQGALNITSLSGPQFSKESQEAESDSCILIADGLRVAVMFMAAPLPKGSWEWPVKLAREWPEAQSVMEGGKGHVVIGAVQAVEGHEAVLKLARAVTIISEAIARFLKVDAILFTSGDRLTDHEGLLAGAREVAAGEVAVDLWTTLQFRLGSSDKEIGVLSYGLAPFVGREVELAPVVMPFEAVAERMWGLCGYLLENGPVIKNGDTLGLSDDERIRATWQVQGLRGDPVIELVMEQVAFS
jgi:hypothetical protein